MGAKREEKREEETGGSLVLPWERREKWVRERVKRRKKGKGGRLAIREKKLWKEKKRKEKEKTKRNLSSGGKLEGTKDLKPKRELISWRK